MPDGPGGWGLPSRTTTTGTGGSGIGGILREFHVPWPACNQDAARQAADAWNALADGLDDVNAECNNLVASIATNNSGAAIDAFASYWQKIGGKSGSLTLSIAACRSLAKACNELADHTSEVKTEIEHKAEELAAMVVAATVALIFTFGASVAVSAELAEQVVTWVTGLIDDLATTVSYTSEQLAADIGFLAAPAGAVAGAATTGIVAGTVGGTFTAVFDEEFQGTLDVLNGEPLPSAGESIQGVLSDGGKGGLLGILAEGTPAVAEELTSTETATEAFEFSPQLSAMLTQSSKYAAWLDTAAGKAFIEGGGIEAMKKAGWLDETGAEGKAVEALLEGPLSRLDPGAGE
jgi:hypothetical protein